MTPNQIKQMAALLDVRKNYQKELEQFISIKKKQRPFDLNVTGLSISTLDRVQINFDLNVNERDFLLSTLIEICKHRMESVDKLLRYNGVEI